MGRFVGQMIKPIFWVEYGLTRFQISTTTPCFVILAAAYFLSSPLAPMGKKNKRSSTSGDVPANTKKHKGSSTTEENLEDDDKPKKPKKAEGKAGGTSEPNTNPRKENVEDDDNKKKANAEQSEMDKGKAGETSKPNTNPRKENLEDDDDKPKKPKKAEQKDLRRRCRKLLERSLSKIRDIHSTETWTTSYTNLCNSWADSRPDIIAPHIIQEEEEGTCASIALYRQWFAMMTLANRKTDGGLTVESISNGPDPQFICESGGLECMEAAIPFMEKHVQKMKVYTRPNPEDVSDLKPFEEFENFVGSLLKKNPIAVHILLYQSYNEVENMGILCPTELERIKSDLANDGSAAGHAALLVGDGVSFINGEKIPYWVLYESSGEDFAEFGFTRIRKNQGLILAAVEIEL